MCDALGLNISFQPSFDRALIDHVPLHGSYANAQIDACWYRNIMLLLRWG